jgi:hypothetical protein
MAQRSPLSTTLSGVAGEYFVAAELSRRGYVASLTLRNTRGIDILVSNADATKSVGVQVKTKQGIGADWVLNKKVESDAAENLFFVFVTLNSLGAPDYYVVPKDDVARFVTDNHALWLKTPGRAGRKHVDNPMRKFKDPEGHYRDKWELLGLDPAV